MQDTITILKSKERRAFLNMVHAQWGGDWKPEEAFAQNTQHRIFLVTPDLAKIEWQRLRISSVGLYIAEVHKERVRLSIEGSQLIGPTATKNIVDVPRETAMLWLKGHDIEVEGEFTGYVIVKSGTDYFGSGPWKEGMLLNHVPKIRRLPENA